MQLREFKSVLSNLSSALSGDDAALIAALVASLPDRTGTVASILGAAVGRSADAHRDKPYVEDVLTILRRAAPLVQTIAKASVTTDYNQLLSWLEQRAQLSVGALTQLLAPPPLRAPPAVSRTAALRDEKVREYVDLLGTSRPGSKTFAEALDKLANDRLVRKQEMIAIAHNVADPNLAASTGKLEALKRIRLPHDAYLDSATRSGAISGTRPPRN
jgi:hypothetical protein